MRFVSLLCLVSVTSAFAAPVPKETEKQQIEKKFGKIVDPKGDSKFSLDGDKLVITLPANETRSFEYERIGNDPKRRKKSSTAPRVDFTVSGDFTVTVRVALDLDPKAKDFRDKSNEAFVGGGIQFLDNESDWYYFGPAQRQSQVGIERIHSLQGPQAYTKGLGVPWVPRGELPNPSWVRMVRVGKVIEFTRSTDGKVFTPLPDQKWEVSDETLALALTALHTSDKAHTVTFDEFKVEQKK